MAGEQFFLEPRILSDRLAGDIGKVIKEVERLAKIDVSGPGSKAAATSLSKTTGIPTSVPPGTSPGAFAQEFAARQQMVTKAIFAEESKKMTEGSYNYVKTLRRVSEDVAKAFDVLAKEISNNVIKAGGNKPGPKFNESRQFVTNFDVLRRAAAPLPPDPGTRSAYSRAQRAERDRLNSEAAQDEAAKTLADQNKSNTTQGVVASKTTKPVAPGAIPPSNVKVTAPAAITPAVVVAPTPPPTPPKTATPKPPPTPPGGSIASISAGNLAQALVQASAAGAKAFTAAGGGAGGGKGTGTGSAGAAGSGGGNAKAQQSAADAISESLNNFVRTVKISQNNPNPTSPNRPISQVNAYNRGTKAVLNSDSNEVFLADTRLRQAVQNEILTKTQLSALSKVELAQNQDYIQALADVEIATEALAKARKEEVRRQTGQTPVTDFQKKKEQDDESRRQRLALQAIQKIDERGGANDIRLPALGLGRNSYIDQVGQMSFEDLRTLHAKLGQTLAEEAREQRRATAATKRNADAAEKRANKNPFNDNDDKVLREARARLARQISETYGDKPNDIYDRLRGRDLGSLQAESAQYGPTFAEAAVQRRIADKAADERRAAQAAALKAQQDADPAFQARKQLDDENFRRQIEIQKQRALVTPPTLANPSGLTAEGRSTFTAQAENSLNAQRIAANKTLIEAQLRSAADLELVAAADRARATTSARLKTAEFKAQSANDAEGQAFRRARAERVIAEREYNVAQRKMNAQVARESGVGGTNLLSRALGRFGSGGFGGGGGGGSGNGGIPPTLTEFFGGGAANIARYAIPGAVGYGILNGITNTIKEAEELQRVFATVESQFDATFGAEGAARFQAFRKEILGIAKETGVAGSELANIGFQLQGAFGGVGDNAVVIGDQTGSALVTNQIRASAEISKVTGLSSKEITDSLTAASLAFGEDFRTIGDVTISLQDRFGVLAKEIIPFLGDIAPVAKDAGFSLAEFATIAATTQQKSGRAGSALAESYGRVLPAIAGARDQLAALALTNPLGDDFIKATAGGSIRDVFFAVSANFEKMSKSSQEFVINLLGGRKEAQAILAAFDDSASLMAAIEDTASNSSGTLAERFERISATVTESLARLQEQFRQLGVQIYEAGLGDALKLLIDLLSALISILDGAFQIIGKFNGALDGWPAKILLVAAAFSVLNSKMGLGLNLGIASSLSAIRGKVTGAQAAATTANASQVGGGLAAAAPLGAAAPAAATGKLKGALGGIGVTAALLATVSFVEFVKGTGEEVENQKKIFATQTVEQLEESLRKAKDPFDNGGGFKGLFRDYKAGVSRDFQNFFGTPGDDDPRNLIRKELNRKNFELNGDAPLQKGDDPSKQVESLNVPAEAIRQALSDKIAIAEIQANVVKNLNASQSEFDIKDAKSRMSAAVDKLGEAKQLGPDNYDSIIEAQANLEALKKEIAENGFAEAEAAIKAAEKRVEEAQNKDPLFGANSKFDSEATKAAKKELEALKNGLGNASNPIAQFAVSGKDEDANKERKKLLEDILSSNPTTSSDALTTILNRASDGSEEASAYFALLTALLGGDGAKAAIQRYKDTIARNKAETDLAKKELDEKKSLEEIKALYDLGAVGITTYVDALTEQIAFFNKIIAERRAQGLGTKDQELSKLKTEAELGNVQSTGAVNLSDFLGELNRVEKGKGDETDLDDIKRLTALLNSGKLNPADRLAKAKEILNLLQAFDEDQEIPPEVREILAQEQLNPKNNEGWSDFLAEYAAIFGASTTGFVTDLVVSIALGKLTLEQVKAIIAAQASNLDEAFAATGFVEFGSGTIKTEAELEALYKRITDFAAGIKTPKTAKSNSGKDPKDLADEIANAKQDYYKSLIEGDPVKVAELAVQQADEDYARAKAGDEGEADRWKAMASKVRALRQLAQAQYGVETSEMDLAAAMAEYKGDTVKAAQLAVDRAIRDRENVNRLFESGGVGEAELNNAEAALLGAKANARDAQLASQKEDYQFLYDMGQITKTQFIQYLQTLKQIPDLTTAQIRDLDRQIKSLQGELQQDLQFNLPNKIKLPTLYEVRRIGQTGSSQAGYVDNRNVTIQINVNDGSGQQQMLQVLTDVMGAPARVSSGTKRY